MVGVIAQKKMPENKEKKAKKGHLITSKKKKGVYSFFLNVTQIRDSERASGDGRKKAARVWSEDEHPIPDLFACNQLPLCSRLKVDDPLPNFILVLK